MRANRPPTIEIVVDKDLKKALRLHAAITEQSISAIARDALNEYLAKNKAQVEAIAS